MASSSIVLITGANTGLGLVTVKSLYQSTNPYTILLGGRSLDKAKSAVEQVQKEFPKSLSTVKAVQVDITDDESISKLFDHVSKEYGRVDVLLNNAGKVPSLPCKHPDVDSDIGAQLDQQWYSGQKTMREMWNESWSVNTTSTHVLTHKFAPLLLNSSNPRLIFITSGTSTLTEHSLIPQAFSQPPEQGWPKPFIGIPAYRSAKTGMNMMMAEWARILKEDGVKVWCISPGFLATGLGGDQEANKKSGALDPTVGANFIRDVVEGARDQDCGKVIRRDNVQPW